MSETPPNSPAAGGLTCHEVNVLLVDDQAMIGEAVRRMLAPETDVRFHYCSDPTQAIAMAGTVKPTIILQDLVMPDVDGLTLVKFFRANAATRDVPIIVLSTKEEPKVKAEAFGLGASDYLVKLPDRIELVARIRHHSQGYINLLQRNEAYAALMQSQQALAGELAEAAAYVESLLPPPITEGDVVTEWRFVPSSRLGGDAFGYHWLDADHFAVYLLDVCGHGVGAALLSISAMNVLRSMALPQTDFRNPGETLAVLNEAFQMEKHNNMYFTIWYGVYQKSTRRLAFASAGHPPSLLIYPGAPGQRNVTELRAKGMVLGGLSGTTYKSEQAEIPPGGILFVLSDGVYEINKKTGGMWEYDDFKAWTRQAPVDDPTVLDSLSAHITDLHGPGALDDDFSVMKLTFR